MAIDNLKAENAELKSRFGKLEQGSEHQQKVTGNISLEEADNIPVSVIDQRNDSVLEVPANSKSSEDKKMRRIHVHKKGLVMRLGRGSGKKSFIAWL